LEKGNTFTFVKLYKYNYEISCLKKSHLNRSRDYRECGKLQLITLRVFFVNKEK